MNPIQKAAFESEIAQARAFMSLGELQEAFAHLETAHVIGQSTVIPHVFSHWLMYVIAVRQRQFLAAWGQLLRIALGALGSAVGVVPTGNTGGSNVSMFKRMAIEPQLQDIIAGRAADHSLRGERD